MLLKWFLLQKWYRIDSDPELENQINDRISFQGGDEPDQQLCSSSGLSEGVDHG
jgi:hypothetical protein